MAKLNVRRMMDTDLPALKQESVIDELDYWSTEKIADSFSADSSCCYVLESVAGKLLGHAIFQCVLDQGSLLNIAVNRNCRRLGYGEHLLLSSLQDLDAQGIRRLLLEVRHSNCSAIALYEKLGFSKDGVRKNYYPSENGFEDALLMSMNIEGGLT